MASEKVVKLTKEAFDTVIAQGITVVDFWATWCGPCRMMSPIIDQLADENEGKATVGKVDVDEQPELATRFGIASIPTIIVFKNGEETARMVGARPKNAIQQAIDA